MDCGATHLVIEVVSVSHHMDGLAHEAACSPVFERASVGQCGTRAGVEHW